MPSRTTSPERPPREAGREVAIRFTVSDEFRDLAPPLYASDGAAGADLRPPSRRICRPARRALPPSRRAHARDPARLRAQVRARSGLALKKGLALANGVGTIDADYRGEVGVIVVNLGDEPVTIARGDRIAQAVVAPVARAIFTPAAGLEESARGAAGSGARARERGCRRRPALDRVPRVGLLGQLRRRAVREDGRPRGRRPLRARDEEAPRRRRRRSREVPRRLPDARARRPRLRRARSRGAGLPSTRRSAPRMPRASRARSSRT